MLLDDLMPRWDARRTERIRVAVPSGRVYAAAIQADFLDAARQSRLVRSLFALRTAAENLVAILRGQRWYPPPEPPALRLIDMAASGEWVKLGENPQREFAFGAVGRFWAGETRWERIDSAGFASFARPGFARIACNLACSDTPDGRTELSYDVRTLATDPASARAFKRYWWVVSPFVGVVMRALLKVVASNVNHRAPARLAHPVP